MLSLTHFLQVRCMRKGHGALECPVCLQLFNRPVTPINRFPVSVRKLAQKTCSQDSVGACAVFYFLRLSCIPITCFSHRACLLGLHGTTPNENRRARPQASSHLRAPRQRVPMHLLRGLLPKPRLLRRPLHQVHARAALRPARLRRQCAGALRVCIAGLCVDQSAARRGGARRGASRAGFLVSRSVNRGHRMWATAIPPHEDTQTAT
jgi:hypothetical protein